MFHDPFIVSEGNQNKNFEANQNKNFRWKLKHVSKETNPAETTASVEVPSKSLRSMETEIVNEKPNQPDSTFIFPKTVFAKQNRSCQAQ